MNNQERFVQMPYIGIPSFLGSQIIRENENVDQNIVFVGVPYDVGSSNRPGARYAPKAIREASMLYTYDTKGKAFSGFYDAELDREILTGVTITDLGDVYTLPEDRKVSIESIVNELGRIDLTKTFPLVAGGDHSISYPCVSALETEVTVIQLDAHVDFMDYSAENYCAHGTSMRRISDLPHVKKIIHFGTRGLLNSYGGIKETRKRGNVVITSQEIHDKGVNIIKDHLDSESKYYISFDVDLVDPSLIPGTGTPEPGGLSYYQVRDVLRIIGQTKGTMGMDIVELNPLFDGTTNSAQYAVRLAIDFLGSHFG